MTVYRERTVHVTTLRATIDEVWAYVSSREAQVKHDPRMVRIDVIEGQWATIGSRMVTTGILDSGEHHTFESELIAIRPPESYTTRSWFPDGHVTGTHQFRQVGGEVEWSHQIDIETRSLTWIERVALRSTRRGRERSTRRTHEQDVAAIRHALEAMRSEAP
ncbi:SRPBCC family protein [Demequina sp. NBRC 110051]|uniref:SRPBCC family protein n=1 Tax=Demequina sp. NBRC 110051 TaxID=1570340 RepID=UPI001181204E|nr:SRPBCC family protein [Demequina sp. NBRC 110051]